MKNNRGVTAIDIAISVILITIFVAVIGNLIVNINVNFENMKRKTMATSYAVKEIEKIKAQGYVENYDDLGINNLDILPNSDVDILDTENNFTGYHKTVSIKDYILLQNDNSKQKNLVKELIVEISYKLANKEQKVSISTFITKY